MGLAILRRAGRCRGIRRSKRKRSSAKAPTVKRCKAEAFSTQILRAQLRWLGHILRRPEDHPLRLICFEPNTDLRPRLTGTQWKRRRGRPRDDWAQVLINILCKFTQKDRAELIEFVKDKRIFHQCVERLCSQEDPFT